MIELHHVHYRYTQTGGWILSDINLEIHPGEYVLLCGASGSGKSTLCRTFNGLIPHFHGGVLEGRVLVAGKDTRTLAVNDLFAQVGMVFQNPEAQLFQRTVERELAFGLENLGLPRASIHARIAASAATVGITDLLPRSPQQLSGGERQLVAIASILALQPQVLVLDEPFAHLDAPNVRRVQAALRTIHRQGMAIILTEHRLQHALSDADRLVVMQQGRIVLDGRPRAVLQADPRRFGMHIPPVVQVAHTLALPEMPLTVEELLGMVDSEESSRQKAAVDVVSGGLGRTIGGLQKIEPMRWTQPGHLRHPPTTIAPPTVLTLEKVSFLRDRLAILRNVSLEVHAGECLAIVGANGAGKTTLIKHLNGLYRPTQGRVWTMGQATHRARVSDLARQVGLAFQNANDQFFTFQVWDEIAVGAHALRCYDEAWLQHLIALLHLEPLCQRSPYRLSEGEKKRVAVASALASRPTILVLDEPTAGQDWNARQALGDLLHSLRSQGQTIILVTHDLDFAEAHAQRWVVLAAGEIVTTGTPWEVMANARVMYQAGLEPTQLFQIHSAMSRGQMVQAEREE